MRLDRIWGCKRAQYENLRNSPAKQLQLVSERARPRTSQVWLGCSIHSQHTLVQGRSKMGCRPGQTTIPVSSHEGSRWARMVKTAASTGLYMS